MDKANLVGRGLAEAPKTPRFAPNSVRVIEVLTYPAVQLLDVTGPLQVFASANAPCRVGLYRRIPARRGWLVERAPCGDPLDVL